MRKTINKELVFDTLIETKRILEDVKFNSKELTQEDINKMYHDVCDILKQCSI